MPLQKDEWKRYQKVVPASMRMDLSTIAENLNKGTYGIATCDGKW